MKKFIKYGIIVWVSVVLLWLIALFIVPMVKRELSLRSISNEIKLLESANNKLQLDINTLWADRKKCEDLQLTTSTQADGKRWAIKTNDNKIEELKLKYNALVGFTQAWQ